MLLRKYIHNNTVEFRIAHPDGSRRQSYNVILCISKDTMVFRLHALPLCHFHMHVSGLFWADERKGFTPCSLIFCF